MAVFPVRGLSAGSRLLQPLMMVWMLLVLLVQECLGHIRLTYPPARKYQFDFLDNARAPGPCGMPKGR